MQKRLISMVLALSMALTAMPLPALAQSAPPDLSLIHISEPTRPY